MNAAAKIRCCLALILLTAGSVMPAIGATVYYVLIPGIPGDSTASQHAGWIVGNAIGAEVTRDPKSLRPVFPRVVVSKQLDKATPLLNDFAARGEKIPEVTIEVEKGGQLIYRIRLRNVLISAVEQAGREPITLEDFFEMDFEAIEWTYTDYTNGPVDHSSYWYRFLNSGGLGPFPTTTPPPPDSDGDGIPDWYENATGLNPAFNDADTDLDGDGESNLAEFIASTRANLPASVFRVRGISKADGSIELTWSSAAGKTYSVAGSNSLTAPFQAVVNDIPSAGEGETSITIPASGSFLFYQIQTQ